VPGLLEAGDDPSSPAFCPAVAARIAVDPAGSSEDVPGCARSIELKASYSMRQREWMINRTRAGVAGSLYVPRMIF
jgi:hypothetical protein